MVDVFRQSIEFRTRSVEYRAQANAIEDHVLRDRIAQLAVRYLDIARQLHSLAVATAMVEELDNHPRKTETPLLAAAQ